MLKIFVKCPWHSAFIMAKYKYFIENNFFVKSKFAGKCGQLPWLSL